MDKNARYKLYKASVYPGWWNILEKYVPLILALDPEAEFYIKEKYGVLRIGMYSKIIPIEKHVEIESAAELESSKICEVCGADGQHLTNRSYFQTLCPRCARLGPEDVKEKHAILAEAEQRWREENGL